ncbi:MAG: flagellar protein FliT [Burkholderiales bacterium]|nr:flagellar protein FliT [Burkholderiales bacterium]
MMNSPQIIAVYEDIRVVTGQMLQAAHNSDWDRLVALEKKRKVLVERLIASEPLESLSGELQQRKAEIIRQVLADDAKIRNLTEPWMQQLQSILSAASHEKKLQQAYQPGNSA